MNWFWFAVIALLCWSGSDFFSKIGCRDSSDKNSHLKMVVAVGVIMGLHAAYEVFLNDVPITWDIIWLYLPVSLLYIVSMALGYVGLRYIELSISSPICNSSGALVAILSIITGTAGEMVGMQYLAVAMACIGVVALRTTTCARPVSRLPITNTPKAGWPWPCPLPTVCWMPPGPLRMLWYWTNWGKAWRIPATWPMS